MLWPPFFQPLCCCKCSAKREGSWYPCSWARYQHISGWFLCSCMARWGSPRLYPHVYHAPVGEWCGSVMCLCEEVFDHKQWSLQKGCWKCCAFRLPVQDLCQYTSATSYLLLMYKLCQEIGNCLCSLLYISAQFQKKILPILTGSEIRQLSSQANLMWQHIFHFYCWHVELSFQSLKDIILKSHRYHFQKYLLLTLMLLPTYFGVSRYFRYLLINAVLGCDTSWVSHWFSVRLELV